MPSGTYYELESASSYEKQCAKSVYFLGTIFSVQRFSKEKCYHKFI